MKRVNRDFKSIKSVVLLPSAGIGAIRNNSMKDVYNAFRYGMGKGYLPYTDFSQTKNFHLSYISKNQRL